MVCFSLNEVSTVTLVLFGSLALLKDIQLHDCCISVCVYIVMV